MVKMILSVAGLVVAGGIFFLFTQPTYDAVKVLGLEIGEYNQALNKASELQQIKQSLLARYNAFNSADVDRLHKMLPDHVDNVRLVLDLDNLASRNGMALQNVIISNPLSEAGSAGAISAIGGGRQKYDSLTLKFATRGTYQNFVTFFQELETSLRVVDLVSLSLEREIASQSEIRSETEPIYRYDMTIRTYWLR